MPATPAARLSPRRRLLAVLAPLAITVAATLTGLPPVTGLMPALAAETGSVSGPRDPAIEAKIADIVSRMTLEEKVGQMSMGSWSATFDESEIDRGLIGAMANMPDAATMAKFQARARAARRGIPLIFARDIIHGYRTLFPVPLGLAASFDERVWETAAELTGREAGAQGVNLAFGPMIDISRDPRWGRVVEGPGEDPFLARGFAAASVRGLAKAGLGATLKHFVGYGAVRAGRDYAEADLSTPLLRDVYLAPFKAGLEAGAPVIMAAFNALNGVPLPANRRMLTDLLKTEWGFDGFVISDWDSVRELLNHGVAGNGAQAAERAVMAGLDMEIAGHFFRDNLPELVRSGRVPMTRIDDAVTRILRTKFRLGLYDPAETRRDPDATQAEAALARPETRAAARDLARRSIVLLKNRDEILPLAKTTKRIAVIGAAARDASDHMGAWGALGLRTDAPVVYEELKRRVGPTTTLTYAEGCDDECTETGGFNRAVATAEKADLVIAVLGEPWFMTAESTSRTRIGLPNHQQALFDRLARTGKPIVLVVFAGRPMVLTEAASKARAVLYAFSPGTMGGPALVDILMGEANPSARLPMTMPRHLGQVPLAYDDLPTGRPKGLDEDDDLWSRYIDEENTPLYPFGWGLSYSRFAYTDLTLGAPTLGRGDTLVAEASVTNRSDRAGREIVQLYVHQRVATRSRPLRQLKAIAVVDLASRETKRVRLTVPVAELGFHDDDGAYRIEPGTFDVYVGGSSLARLSGAVTLLGE
ncbi:glycoside hydrolase family 3 N-terminal domain-containing protein [Methyloraptor flagellatus]|uniref:beta-glucosidase n=1 Tax=Methyloraptor flagellatus TaxID=3162530 RepID=A0AAU7X8S8_9HYPH